MGVLHPLVHRTRMTKTSLKTYICLSAVAIIVMMATSLVYPKLYFVFGTVNICISLTLIGFFYTRIFQTARRRFRLENRPGHQFRGTNPSEEKGKQQFAKEIKIAKSCFLIVVVFLFCVMPVSIVSVLSPNVRPKMLPLFRVIQSWAITITLLNHSLNSIIFFWTMAMLRNNAKNVLKKIFAK
jgi:anaerobic C4-dicarboxylate transporter